MKHLLIQLFTFFQVLFVFGQNHADTNVKKLILFYNSNEAIIENEEIESLQNLSSSLELDFVIIDVLNGSPKKITYTPTLVFQNESGRSIYYGRYKNLDRLKNFIRTSTMVHQKEVDNEKSDILIWKNEKTTVTAPLKLTQLAGHPPKKFNQKEFDEMARKEIYEGMCQFELTQKINQTRTMRSFYFNLYPYLDEKQNLTISGEIFSQYNCVKPVFQKFENGIVQGKWKNRFELFNKAGEIIEKEILNLIENSKEGDAFKAIPETIAVKSWKELGLNIAEGKIDKSQSVNKDFKLAKEWKVEKKSDDPIIIFSFLPPLDNYAGEARSLTGNLVLSNDGSIENASGTFVVEIADVTMGADDFDYEVQNKMLKMGVFPNSTFKFESLKRVAKDGNLNLYEAAGTFTLLGIKYPLKIDAEIYPFQNNDQTYLKVKTSFELSLFKNFKLEGPDGPSPSKDVLQFFMNFDLIPN